MLMRSFASVLALCAATTAGAEECDFLGVTSPHLLRYFCRQIDIITEENRTRDTTIPELPQGADFEWLDIPELRDAYRSDPRKTLELIERIRLAGGLEPVN